MSEQIVSDYQPSPRERVRNQVARYEATDGREGGTNEGRPVVILTTIGARSGAVRKTPVMRIERDGVYAVIASAAGAADHPAWYRNLLAHPDHVTLRDLASVRQVRPREISGAEKDDWWLVAEANWPHFPEYRAKAAGREIPIVLLEPTDETVANEQKETTSHGA
jgi:deazaflavin-dependent oxidoreductase (nitroreductase family)